MRVLALTKYGTLAASTRQRFLLYGDMLAEAGIEVTYSPLFGNDYLEPLMRGGRPSPGAALKGYARRVHSLTEARNFDLLWVHCEFFPYLPAAAEVIAARCTGRPIVYDYDDAIFHMYDQSSSSAVRLLLSGKLQPLMERAAACLCGNAYLRDYATRYCVNSVVMPTVVDTSIFRPGSNPDRSGPVVIGWIGSPSTWPNVRPLLPILTQLCEERGALFRAIGAGQAADRDRFAGLEVVDWSEADEVEQLQQMDIGIMPLLDQPFQRGKSGYKLIQYMACGLPSVASPVGVNQELVSDGGNGFLATSDAEWHLSLTRLIDDAALRQKLGSVGRDRAVKNYSLQAQGPRMIAWLRSAAGSTAARRTIQRCLRRLKPAVREMRFSKKSNKTRSPFMLSVCGPDWAAKRIEPILSSA